MHAPLLHHGERAFPIAYKQSRWLVHLQQPPKQLSQHLSALTNLPASIQVLLVQPAMREDCTREQTKRILAGICCKGGIAAWRSLSNSQEERNKDSEEQVPWRTQPGDLVHVCMQRTHCTCAWDTGLTAP